MTDTTDLLINPDGSIYHLCLKPEEVAEWVIIAGDPGRIPEISSFFDVVELRKQNREFVTHTGIYRGLRITALSTGIGTDNIDIVMQELDALVNFDLQLHEPKATRRSLNIIRVGTAGAIQPDIPVNRFSLSTHAMGLDNLICFYEGSEAILDIGMTNAFSEQTSWDRRLTKPYFVRGSSKLIGRYTTGTISGITVTAPGFYAPQGRSLFLQPTDPEMIRKLQAFQYNQHRIINYEMETSALYGLGALMGHETVTICALIANRATGEYNPDHAPVIHELIGFVLDGLIG